MVLQSGKNTPGRTTQEAAMKMVPKTVLSPGMLQCFITDVDVLVITNLEQNLLREVYTLFSTLLVFREI